MSFQDSSGTEINDADAAAARAMTVVSPSSFWFPLLSSFGSGWAEHAPFAFWLIDALRPKVFVELGTHKGYSFAAVCQAVARFQIDSRCFAVDTWQGDEHAGFYPDAIFDEVSTYLNEHYSSFARLVRSTFDEALPHFEDGTVELLHVDGRHHYDDAKHDYKSWISKLAPNAVVLFHDINVRERGFGVYQLWDELKKQHQHFEFLHGNGLGVLGLGSDLPDRVKKLLALSNDPKSAAVVQDIYSRLGKAISHHYDVKERGPDVVGALRGGIKERDDEIIRFRAETSQLRQEIGASLGLVKERDAEILRLRAAVSRLNSTNHLREDFLGQQRTIKALQASLTEANLRLSTALATSK
ncbi:class I SAM-dependent methyltransferase [Tardiphaga sp. vice278]|uniref:class I SAM-dependent methyltransferase n=1 Tax=Tardiphaga sp. vice278 TaxID=2592815 RepID=UPI0011623E92|nr:class I SAM-dependent methyltransferase [Tardiphaga sp. vice278]QDM17946.1 class I SAM-dependent methyltransferase [Tardiphaga sp. vice278]